MKKIDKDKLILGAAGPVLALVSAFVLTSLVLLATGVNPIEPIRHLRRYSNYLTPKLGLFSADTWVLGAIYLRNTLINLLILVPAVMGFVCLGHLLAWAFGQGGEASGTPMWVTGMVTLAFGVLGGIALICESRNRPAPSDKTGTAAAQPTPISLREFRWLITAPLVLAAVAGAWAFTIDPVQAAPLARRRDTVKWMGTDERITVV